MLTADFDYHLPKELVAQTPLEPRDQSRLMVVDKKTPVLEPRGRLSTGQAKKVEHKRFYDIVDYLKKGDLLVWNNTKVFKARLRGQLMLDENVVDIPSFPRRGRGGLPLPADKTSATPSSLPLGKGEILNASPVEIFLVRPMENNKVWKVLAKPGRKLRLGMKIVFAKDFSAEVMLKENDGTFLIQFAEDDMSVRAKANKYGFVPLPPYIKSESVIPSEVAQGDRRGISVGNKTDRDPSHAFGMTSGLSERYQTVYAKEEGSVAAPTAGFHFTPELIEKLKNKGVEFAEVTLHVGLGTFLPVKTEKVEDHKMHSEWVEVTAKNADLINQAKAEGRRVVAVGTTTVRVLEGVMRLQQSDFRLQHTTSRLPKSEDRSLEAAALRPYSGYINIFITPGFEFKIVDALITNFHLPKSTLLMLVSAFAEATADKSALGEGRKFILDCYKKAVEEKYRFFSFGDAMFIK